MVPPLVKKRERIIAQFSPNGVLREVSTMKPSTLKPRVLPPPGSPRSLKNSAKSAKSYKSSENKPNHANAKTTTNAPGASKKTTKRRKKKNDKHNSIIPDIVEERHRSSDKVERYTKGKYLGKGGFARCYTLTSLTTGNVYAGKVVAKSSLKKEKAQQKLVAEIKIHQHLHHPNIVRFYHSFQDRQNVYILLELCNNQSLMELLKTRKRLTEPEVRFYMLQIIDAVEYLHRNNVIHRDLKLGNLFLNHQLQVKLGDMGLSTKLDKADDRKKTICGTPNYIAPEIISGGTHSFEVDIWSLGVILFTMLVGKPPFETRDVKATYKRIKRGSYTFPDTVELSKDGRHLIEQLLQLVPEKRPSLAQIKNHSFFTRANAFTPRLGELPVSSLKKIPTFDARVIEAAAARRGSTSNNSSNNSCSMRQQCPSSPSAPPPAPSTSMSSRNGIVAPQVASNSNSVTSVNATEGKVSAAATRTATTTARSSEHRGTDKVTSSAVSSGTGRLQSSSLPSSSSSSHHRSPRHSQFDNTRRDHNHDHKRTSTAAATATTTTKMVATKAKTIRSPAVEKLLDMESRANFRSGFHKSTSDRLAGLTEKMERMEYHSTGRTSRIREGTKHKYKEETRASSSSSSGSSAVLHADMKTQRSCSVGNCVGMLYDDRKSEGSTMAMSNGGGSTMTEVSSRDESVGSSSSNVASSSSSSRGNTNHRHGRHGIHGGTSTTTTKSSSSSSGKMSTLKAMHRELSRSLVERDAVSSQSSSGGNHGDRYRNNDRHVAESGGCTARSSRDFDAGHSNDKIVPPSTWVVKHVDYTRKYGFGYLLSNNAVGVYFNDSTKIILSPDNHHFEYIERMSCSTNSGLPPRHAHTLDDYPETLKKKVTLLVHFKAHLCSGKSSPSSLSLPAAENKEERSTTNGDNDKNMSKNNAERCSNTGMTYVKKWVRTNRCLLFRLSDRSVQVAFFDNTEIILSQCGDVITLTYIGKDKVRTSYSLQGVMESSKSHILKRLRYCKLVIHELLSGKLSHHSSSTKRSSSGRKEDATTKKR